MNIPRVSPQDLRLIASVITEAMTEVGVDAISWSAASRRVFELVEGGERDFEVLKAAAMKVRKPDAGTHGSGHSPDR